MTLSERLALGRRQTEFLKGLFGFRSKSPAAPMARDPQNGKYRQTRLFVMTFSNSRIWAELPEV